MTPAAIAQRLRQALADSAEQAATYPTAGDKIALAFLRADVRALANTLEGLCLEDTLRASLDAANSNGGVR